MSLSLKEKQLNDYTKEEIILILKQYIIEQKELAQRKMVDEDSFNKPSWPEYQAFQLGIVKALNKLDDFIPTKDGT
jgi:hypothetical protein